MNKHEWVLKYMSICRGLVTIDAAIAAYEKVAKNGRPEEPVKDGPSLSRRYVAFPGAIVKIAGIPCRVMGRAEVETATNLRAFATENEMFGIRED